MRFRAERNGDVSVLRLLQDLDFNASRGFRHMLEEALTLIAADDIGAACDQLQAALIHADGEPQPGDFIAGAERASLASEIVDLRTHLGCSD